MEIIFNEDELDIRYQNRYLDYLFEKVIKSSLETLRNIPGYQHVDYDMVRNAFDESLMEVGVVIDKVSICADTYRTTIFISGMSMEQEYENLSQIYVLSKIRKVLRKLRNTEHGDVIRCMIREVVMYYLYHQLMVDVYQPIIHDNYPYIHNDEEVKIRSIPLDVNLWRYISNRIYYELKIPPSEYIQNTLYFILLDGIESIVYSVSTGCIRHLTGVMIESLLTELSDWIQHIAIEVSSSILNNTLDDILQTYADVYATLVQGIESIDANSRDSVMLLLNEDIISDQIFVCYI